MDATALSIYSMSMFISWKISTLVQDCSTFKTPLTVIKISYKDLISVLVDHL